jgi:hypothetical protein
MSIAVVLSKGYGESLVNGNCPMVAKQLACRQSTKNAWIIDDDDGDFYSVTLAFRQTTGKKRMGVSEMA